MNSLNKDEYLQAKEELFGSAKGEEIKKLINNFFDKRDLAKKILEAQPIHYDTNKIWWFWNEQEYRWKLIDETDILNFVDSLSNANTIRSNEKSEILEALKQVSRAKKPKDVKKSWIQFKNIIIDTKTGEQIKVSSEYFVTNPIPYPLDFEKYISEKETPTIDKLFTEWVGPENVKKLYEIISYCMLSDYPIHRIFCLIGSGANGKSCYLRLIKKFIGEENVTATELDTLINSRFEVTKLHKKLVCMMGETNFNELSKTSIIKRLTGQDLMGFEYKNKNPFTDYNYAKIIIATNNLPTTSDKTIGFYRRWEIIDFPNHFKEEKDILSTIPESEFEVLTVKLVFLLQDLLSKGKFDNEDSIEERAKKYEEKSDPLEKFMKEFCDFEDLNAFVPKWEFEKRLKEWLKENRFREIAEIFIAKKMKEKNVEQSRRAMEWHSYDKEEKKMIRVWLGVRWK